jgi:hypothetical protein
MREPYPGQSRQAHDQDRLRREELGARIVLEAGTDERDEEVDDDEEADKDEPDDRRDDEVRPSSERRA